MLQFVVGVENRRRLDIQGLAARRFVVDKTLKAAAMIGPYRQNITTVALGDEIILKDAGVPLGETAGSSTSRKIGP
jgi:hypothetical protein